MAKYISIRRICNTFYGQEGMLIAYSEYSNCLIATCASYITKIAGVQVGVLSCKTFKLIKSIFCDLQIVFSLNLNRKGDSLILFGKTYGSFYLCGNQIFVYDLHGRQINSVSVDVKKKFRHIKKFPDEDVFILYGELPCVSIYSEESMEETNTISIPDPKFEIKLLDAVLLNKRGLLAMLIKENDYYKILMLNTETRTTMCVLTSDSLQFHMSQITSLSVLIEQDALIGGNNYEMKVWQLSKLDKGSMYPDRIVKVEKAHVVKSLTPEFVVVLHLSHRFEIWKGNINGDLTFYKAFVRGPNFHSHAFSDVIPIVSQKKLFAISDRVAGKLLLIG